ncbi:MAG: surfeit locus 1 family protein [Idiomarinaceae bacterium HL-53]|nr:MAG: surfeit locus 1 family protein [Idiomarinaceae bacterium HL-53]CUS47592.1 surfeit locus 1 family protein [Idiomarinaceae bacterium HL-53]
MAVLRIGSSQFKLNPIALVLTLLAIALMIKLGFWQIDRGQEKAEIITQNQEANERGLQPITNTLIPELAERSDQLVTWQGKVTNLPYFLIENQIHEGQVGYHVIAMVTLNNSQQVIPVNFGWVAAAADRSINPELPNISDQLTSFEGRSYIPSEPFMLQAQAPAFQEGAAFVRLQYPELKVIQDYLANFMPRENVAPFIVRLAPEEGMEWVREWPIVVMTPHKHYAYAAQWFSLALAAAFVFLFASRVRNAAQTKDS